MEMDEDTRESTKEEPLVTKTKTTASIIWRLFGCKVSDVEKN